MSIKVELAKKDHLKFGVQLVNGEPYLQDNGEARYVEVRDDEDVYYDSESQEIFVRKKTNST